MNEPRQIMAFPIVEAVIVSTDCARELVGLGLLTEDRTDEEQDALSKLAAALDLLDPGHGYTLDVMATRERR